MSLTISARASELVQQIENTAVAQKVKVYSMQTKDGIVQIIGRIDEKIVIIKAQVSEMGSGAMGKVQEVSLTARATGAAYSQELGNTLKSKAVVLQDGYVYITCTVGGQLSCVKAKVVDTTKSSALTLYKSSRERMEPALHKMKPYYVKVENGMADIVGTVNKSVVVVRAKIGDRYTSMQVWTLQSLDGARALLDGYTSPLLSRAISLRQSAATKVDHILVSVRDGAVHVKGVVGERILNFQTKLSETALSKHMLQGWQSARQATLEVTSKLLKTVSDAYGRGLDSLKLIQFSIKDKFLYISCQVNDRFVVVRIKVAEVAEHLQARTLELYAVARTGLVDACSGAKTQILNSTEATRNKAIEASMNARSLAKNPDAQAAAAGAVALGASGGVTGLFAGAALGAVCALPAAFFTFGLSIPVGAAVGAGGGLCVGGSAGAVTGGVAGYKAHKDKESIGNGMSSAFAKAKARKDMAFDSASNLRSNIADRIKSRTGGA